MVGRTLSHYKILEEIGRGGMGIVYRAKDLKLIREVALKVLDPKVVADSDRRGRFVREAQAAAALDHPHIETVHEIDEKDGLIFIVMELIRGERLRDALDRGRLTISEALDLAIEVAEGISCAHDKGIVHRDLKPSNIMVTEHRHAKVIDFGLAKLRAHPATDSSESLTLKRQETETGLVFGTVSYMSPEQARGQSADSRSDIFSFGIVLFEMLTGQLPFKAPSTPEILSAIINTPAPPLEPSIGEGIAPDLQPLMDKCLAKDSNERYQTMKDLCVDLRMARRRLESGAGVAAAGRIRSRHRSLIALVALAAAIALFAVVVGFNIEKLRGLAGDLFTLGEKPVPFSERDWVLIVDFENTTSEEIFDKSLNTAFRVGIEQSRHINVLPRRRIDDTLRRMNKPDV